MSSLLALSVFTRLGAIWPDGMGCQHEAVSGGDLAAGLTTNHILFERCLKNDLPSMGWQSQNPTNWAIWSL
ncbi:hypothetical protein K449DRAFT_392312 [Hypoxylon sp. EC38]|nr:hypothetical protein K449DRAFT_392312 [Hypoxylon sp. EC38]